MPALPRQSGLSSRWSLEMRRSDFFHAGDRVGVAVSGGPDSILLLAFMTQLAREVGLTLAAVHFNHHLRGPESDADELFVGERAVELGIDCLHGEADVARAAREKHRNLEATARNLRYRFFFSLLAPGRLDKLVTAHTANDQAETVLLRLLRGTGTRGLGGIYPVLEGKIVRPFLNITRAEIERELRERKLEWRLDSTNLNPQFRRNKIRMELLPWLRKEFNSEIISSLKELADRARDDEEYLEQQARERAGAWRVREGAEERIPVRSLTEFPPAVARRVLRQMILAVRGNLRGITYQHVESLRRLVAVAQSGRKIVLPGGCEARKDFDWLIIAPPQPISHQSNSEYCFPLKIPGEVFIPQLGLTFQFKIIGPGAPPEAYNRYGAAGLDPLKLSGPLVLRNWRAGDRFWMSGSRKIRNLKDIFFERKIPLRRRKLWPVLACGEKIVWVRDLAPAHGVAASDDSERILVMVSQTELSRKASCKV
jgi:tRNA(Ile)-lysidine synthase